MIAVWTTTRLGTNAVRLSECEKPSGRAAARSCIAQSASFCTTDCPSAVLIPGSVLCFRATVFFLIKRLSSNTFNTSRNSTSILHAQLIHLYLSIYLYVCLSIYLSFFLIYPSIHPSFLSSFTPSFLSFYTSKISKVTLLDGLRCGCACHLWGSIIDTSLDVQSRCSRCT